MADTVHADRTASTIVPDPLWDDWDTSARVPGIPELHLTGFAGPMDLLLVHRLANCEPGLTNFLAMRLFGMVASRRPSSQAASKPRR